MEELCHLVGDCHRPVVTASASKGDIEMILPLVDVARYELLDERVVLVHELICEVRLEHVVYDFLVVTGELLEALYVVRIRYEPDINHDV